jgi:DNA-directed RNA polymerase subunit K/omega
LWSRRLLADRRPCHECVPKVGLRRRRVALARALELAMSQPPPQHDECRIRSRRRTATERLECNTRGG